MKDRAFRAEYDRLKPEFALALAFIKARNKAGMTQADVAKKMRTTQSVVARIESGRNPPTLRTLERYAHAVGQRIEVKARRGLALVGKAPRLSIKSYTHGFCNNL